MEALLVTPLPPQPTGLADYARRILDLTAGHVSWRVAYPAGAEPLEGYPCLPVKSLTHEDLTGNVVYQIGNSLHCTEIIDTLMEHPGTALFHETNLHHALRQMADTTGNWRTYEEHVENDYGPDAPGVLKAMGKPARSLSEYDARLRQYPLTGTLTSSATEIAVLSDTARMKMEALLPGRTIHRMGFLPDFMERVAPPPRKHDETVIGIAGTYHYGRNWEAMFQAVSMLRSEYPCRLLVAGSRWPDPGVNWAEVTGRLSDTAFRESIELFDIALDLRSDTCSETSGSMMDILRSGKPAVLSSEGSFRDIPAGAVLRIPAESGAAGALAAMRYLLDNPGVRSSISKGAEEYFLGISNREACLEQWLSLLRRGRNAN